MAAEDLKELQKSMTEMLVMLGRLDEQVKMITQMSSQVQELQLKVNTLERDLKTSFVNQDLIRKSISELDRAIERYKTENKNDFKWIIGAAFGAIGTTLAVINWIGGV